VTSMPDLVALLYRADWKQLSLSARITWKYDHALDRELRLRAESGFVRRWRAAGNFLRIPDVNEPGYGLHPECRVLLAPGGRYRVQAGADAAVTGISDGGARWKIDAGMATRRPTGGPDDAFRGMITPRWLLAWYDLEITGSSEVSGRPAHQLAARPRAVTTRFSNGTYLMLDRVEVLVDAELGIIVRSEQIFAGQTLELAQLHDLVIDPPLAADPAMFALPPGVTAASDTFEPPQGRGWQAAAAAAGLAASAMGFAARHAPHRVPQATPGDAEVAMPAASAGPVAGADREPISDDLVNLLHRTGLPPQAFTADLHQWTDEGAAIDAIAAMRHAMPQPLEGIFGPDALWDALDKRWQENGSQHKTARLRVAMPGKYRIDYLTGDWNRRNKTVACDGEHTRKLFDDHVAVGPARRLRKPVIADLVDPAWLLSKWRLSAAGEASVAGRPGFRIVAEPSTGIVRAGGISALEVIVDAELGVVLRQTDFAGGRPVMRSELRNLTAVGSSDSPGDFGLDAVAGQRVVTDSGGLLGGRNLAAPVQATKIAAALAAGGAIAVTGWLDKHRARRSTGTHK